MKYKAILFDMDGTLLPMDTPSFTKSYLKLLAKELMPYGIAPDSVFKVVMGGVARMAANDGRHTNEDVFWEYFEEKTGVAKEKVNPVCIRFYSEEFHQAKAFTRENPLAKEMVRIAHEKAPLVLLATNPLFPMAGQISRMSWVGLKPEDFDLVTCYEQEVHSKPNPAFFIDVCARFGLDPKECLMIGNDDEEDMYAASSLGMDTWLVTDDRIVSESHPWNGVMGSFAEILERMKAL